MFNNVQQQKQLRQLLSELGHCFQNFASYGSYQFCLAKRTSLVTTYMHVTTGFTKQKNSCMNYANYMGIISFITLNE